MKEFVFSDEDPKYQQEEVIDVTKMKLGEYLIYKKILKPEELTSALMEQVVTKEKLGVILVRNGFITKSSLTKAILEISPDKIYGESAISTRIPPEKLVKQKTMIINESENNLYVATAGKQKEVKIWLSKYYPELKIVFLPLAIDTLEKYFDSMASASFEEASEIEDDENIVEKIVRNALSNGASDIHIEPQYSCYKILFRENGIRRERRVGTLEEYNVLISRIKDKSRMDIAERRSPQDGSFSIEFNGKLVDMRVATVITNMGEKIVIRLLDSEKTQPNLNLLGISNVAAWRRGVSRPNGLCLICGPTGSGKTTTLNSTIKEFDRFSRAIYTLEDPVEYTLPYVSQVNINPAVGLDFPKGVKNFMRADPDIIVLGEIRDAETARNAIKAAETGHLVIATLHTNGILSTVARLRDLGIHPHELLGVLRVILVQNLVRTLCHSCKGTGCAVCDRTGYKGRTIISECQYFKDENAVSEILDPSKMMKGKPWVTIMEDAINKVSIGVTDEKEVINRFGEDAKDEFDEVRRRMSLSPEERAKEDAIKEEAVLEKKKAQYIPSRKDK